MKLTYERTSFSDNSLSYHDFYIHPCNSFTLLLDQMSTNVLVRVALSAMQMVCCGWGGGGGVGGCW